MTRLRTGVLVALCAMGAFVACADESLDDPDGRRGARADRPLAADGGDASDGPDGTGSTDGALDGADGPDGPGESDASDGPDGSDGGGPPADVFPEAPGKEVLDLTACSGTAGHDPALGGNTTSPIVAWKDLTFATWLAPNGRPVVSMWDGKTCTTPFDLDTTKTSGASSHDAPSIFMDGSGYLYALFFGELLYDGKGNQAPYLRRSSKPRDASAWEPQQRARLWNYAEVHGQQLVDGGVLLVGADMPARIDILEPGGAYRWPAARQFIAQDTSRSAAPTGCTSGGPTYLNRFTKAVVHQGPDGTLYTTWGWASGYYDSERPSGLCGDIRHYTEDSHEVFFAYSKDDGLTWKNLAGTKTVASVPCTSLAACESATAGISHNDPAFRITTQRQRQHRKIWVEPNGTIYLAFEHSTWCDSGVCNQNQPSASAPGGLAMLEFKLGGAVTHRMVNTNGHTYIGGIRKAGNKLYVWAREDTSNAMYEYVSDDDGVTWSRTSLASGSNGRLHGATVLPGLNSIRLLFNKSTNPRSVFIFKRAF